VREERARYADVDDPAAHPRGDDGMKSQHSHRPYLIALSIFLVAVLGILFLPRLLYGAFLESGIEDRSESLLTEYAEQVGRRLKDDPAGNSWRDVRGARVLGERRPDRSSLIISTAVTVEAGGLLLSSGFEVRCYDIVFTRIGGADQRYDLEKVPGCEEELRGPSIPGRS
jgi:hypothetical protein